MFVQSPCSITFFRSLCSITLFDHVCSITLFDRFFRSLCSIFFCVVLPCLCAFVFVCGWFVVVFFLEEKWMKVSARITRTMKNHAYWSAPRTSLREGTSPSAPVGTRPRRDSAKELATTHPNIELHRRIQAAAAFLLRGGGTHQNLGLWLVSAFLYVCFKFQAPSFSSFSSFSVSFKREERITFLNHF